MFKDNTEIEGLVIKSACDIYSVHADDAKGSGKYCIYFTDIKNPKSRYGGHNIDFLNDCIKDQIFKIITPAKPKQPIYEIY